MREIENDPTQSREKTFSQDPGFRTFEKEIASSSEPWFSFDFNVLRGERSLVGHVHMGLHIIASWIAPKAYKLHIESLPVVREEYLDLAYFENTTEDLEPEEEAGSSAERTA